MPENARFTDLGRVEHHLARVQGLIRFLTAFGGLAMTVCVGLPTMLIVMMLLGRWDILDPATQDAVYRWLLLPLLGSAGATLCILVWLRLLTRLHSTSLFVVLVLCALALAAAVVESAMNLPHRVGYLGAAPSTWLLVLLSLVHAGLSLYIYFVLVSGSWSASKAARHPWATAIRESTGTSGALAQLFGIPAHVSLLLERKRHAVLLFAGRTLLLSLGIFLFANVTLFPLHLASAAIIDPDSFGDQMPDVGPLLLLVATGPMLLVFFSRVATWVEGRAQRSVRLTLEQALQFDKRAPVLFLRPFSDDQVKLAFSWRMAIDRLLRAGRQPARLDHLLVDEGFLTGPVVAIGKPGDPYPPYGAARGYFDSDTWQKVVEKLCREASAIVICVDDSEGVWWEVGHLAQAGHLGKTLMLIHPRYRDTAENRKLLSLLLAKTGRTPPNVTDPATSPVLGLRLDAETEIGYFHSSTFGDLAYLALMRWFLRCEVRGDRVEAGGTGPLKPRTDVQA